MATGLGRLRTYTRMQWEKEVPVLRGLGLEDGMSVVELGSGPGVVTDLLLDLLPTSEVTSVEINEAQIERAEGYLRERGRVHPRLVQADIMETGLPPSAFDFAYARLVFRHVSDPLRAAREAYRILKPGGRLVIVDADLGLWGLTDPPVPELSPALEAYGRMAAERGEDVHIGRQLAGVLRAAGFAQRRIETVAITNEDLREDEGPTLETLLTPIGSGRLERMAKEGWLSERERVSFRRARKRFLAIPSPFILKVMLMASGAKGGSQGRGDNLGP